MADYTRYDLDQITGWTASVFESLGAARPDASVTAETLIHADLMGIDSHGLNRLPVANYAGGLSHPIQNRPTTPGPPIVPAGGSAHPRLATTPGS